MSDSFEIGSQDWLIPVLILGVALFGLTLWNYRGFPKGGWLAFGWLLKLAGIAILLLCLLEPMGRGERPRPQANVLPILIDTSQSMSLEAGGESPENRIRQAFEDNNPWLERLEQVFDVRKFQFGSRTDIVDSVETIAFEQQESNLVTSLRGLATRFEGRPVAGVMLLTDGNATDRNLQIDWTELGVPVYPVVDMNADPMADLRFGDVTISETDFETAPITISTTLISSNIANQAAVVELLDRDGQMLEQQTVSLDDAAKTPITFRFRPKTSGVSFFRLQCFLESEKASFVENNSAIEATLENNRRWVAVNQRSGPYNVLYVSGRPNWEYKYLRRAVDEDAEVRLVGLIRMAKKQPKFSFRDSSVQSSANPLFAGLGGDEEEIAEQLDEPVVLAFGVEDEKELATGFPSDGESLFKFSAIIIDDVEADFFTQDQLMLIRQFVSFRGGALLMLGGDDSLEKGGYDDSPLADLAPVYLTRGPKTMRVETGENRQFSQGYKFELTREGLLQPFLRLRATEEEESKRIKNSVPLKVLNKVERIKPGAIVLATVTDRMGEVSPALVSQSFGRGKTVGLMLGDLWRWSLGAIAPETKSTKNERISGDTESNEDPSQAWRQVVRWLVSDVQRSVEITVEPTQRPSVMKLTAEVRDSEFKPLDNAKVQIEVVAPDNQTVTLDAVLDNKKPGRYTIEYWSRSEGGYLAKANVSAADGSLVGSSETGWVSEPGRNEYATLGTDLDLLRRIATETKGELVDFNTMNEFSDLMSNRPVPVTETWRFPLWHRWWVVVLAIGCLCGDWGIRRWRGLA